MGCGRSKPFKVYEHGGQNTEICKQFTRKIEKKGNYEVSVRTDIKKPSFLYVHEVTRVFHDIKSALNSAGNIKSTAFELLELIDNGNATDVDNSGMDEDAARFPRVDSYDAVVVFRKLTQYEKPDSSDLYSKPRPLGIPNELPIVACYWLEKNCKQQLCNCEENEKSVKKLVHLIKKDTACCCSCLFSRLLCILGVLNRCCCCICIKCSCDCMTPQKGRVCRAGDTAC
ncbi:uncharacterized protein LOC131705081 [Acipenser ruthenus]|uniref:uncharacterized protein LOC131705081 n=1 Tax=Acipenser ruthenus TaxID=7906 RepID=UPI002741BFC7|nr:uncharacterized protein LOC131705081 [Acipenser ruthenus]